MHSPDFLKEGDKVRIVATARKVSPEELKPAILKLKDWGLRVELGENIFAQEHQFAGNDTQRADDLQNALNDRDCAAILCARGGYGTVRIIDNIDWDAFKQNPKWIIGYSDVSVLHNTLQNMGFASLHASMALDFTKNSPESLTLIREALFGQYYQVKAPAHAFNQLGSVEGEIVGGNLSMLYSCLGSQSAIKPAGQILFFEDLDE
jgi:muramoyltetrapeptide carboxypeptidase